MRILLILVCFTLLSTQCASKKNTISKSNKEEKIVFIYKHYTRGFYREYHIKEKKIRTINDYQKTNFIDKETIPLDWATCLNFLSSIDLKTINQLESPSNLRQTDRVHHAEISIIINDTIFRSNSFDHENPPKALKPLVDNLIYMVSNN